MNNIYKIHNLNKFMIRIFYIKYYFYKGTCSDSTTDPSNKKCLVAIISKC